MAGRARLNRDDDNANHDKLESHLSGLKLLFLVSREVAVSGPPDSQVLNKKEDGSP